MQGIDTVAQLMAMAAITAPKTRGENFVQVKLLEGQEVQQLGQAMIVFGQTSHKGNFDRDGQNVLNSEVVVLIGIKDAAPADLNCAACGYETCAELSAQEPVEGEFRGPTCAYRLLDMGIALGSAVKIAGMLNVDNRIMYRAGVVARQIKLVDWDFVMGIPLSVTGKSIFLIGGNMKGIPKTTGKESFKISLWGALIFILCVTWLAGCVMPVDKKLTTPTSSLLTLLAPSATPLPSPTVSEDETATPQPLPTTAPAAPHSKYTFKVTFDYARHHLVVNQTITYFNRSPDTISELQLVVEPNRTPGIFQLDSMTWAGGDAVTGSSLKGPSLQAPLPQALAPGNSITLNLNYQLSLPQRNGILGYDARQTNLGDWYPFLPYYQAGTGWLVYTPTGLGEYLAYDIADFEVEILPVDPPDNLVISASSQAEGDAQAGYHCQLSQARNFAWSASQQMEVLTGSAGTVKLLAVVFPGDKPAGETALKTMREAVQTYGDLYGTYPHPSLTMVEANFFDGMEYDGFIFLDQNYFTRYAGGPEAYLVTLTAHETAHQWWYGLAGNDQAMEPWLDESLATYSELLFYERIYPGEVNWWWNFRVNRFTPSGWINSNIYDYTAFRPYVDAVYLRGALFLQALRVQVGDQEFLAFLKDYATRYRQGWVSGADFFNVLGDHTQQNLDSLIGDYFKKP